MARFVGPVLLAVLLLGLVPGADAASIDAPRLTAGDFWTFRTNSTLPAGFVLRGEFTSTVRDRTTVTLEGASVDVFRLDVSGSGTASGRAQPPYGSGSVTGTWILTGQEFLEAADLKLAYSLLDLTVNGTYEGLLSFRFHVTNTTTYRVLQNAWTYPLQEGGSGSVVYRLNYSQDGVLTYGFTMNSTHTNGTATWAVLYAMDPATGVSTPAGTFSAYPVQETWPDGSRDRRYYAPAVGNDVRTEAFNETGSPVGTTELVTYRYQAAEPPRVLGLTANEWILVGTAVGTGVLATVFLLRRRAKRRGPVPPSMQGPSGRA